MQQLFSLTRGAFRNVENALSPGRLSRYMHEARQDPHTALRLYLWNVRLCESAYLACQVAEVSYRNAVHQVLRTRYPGWWVDRNRFIPQLPKRLRDELDRVVKDVIKNHSADPEDYVVSGLSLGFWLHMTSKSFRKNLFVSASPLLCRSLPAGLGVDDVYDAVDKLRNFRNRIAHHKPIFDRNPDSHVRRAKEIVSWFDGDTYWLVEQICRFNGTYASKPSV
ncbi:MAG: Abi family protein [Alphaproteobacteria bacterium]|nr:Abi family protein [Alphaproteobacteria bacterium]